ncbi:hypothetical protein ACBY01_03710 [Sphingomonas sp. ac-8]|uniref:hypothetical protein n=1 Tax=Sphingomonas sp. ac-8 TaxID=3242977 RepID=UPI003A80E2AF
MRRAALALALVLAGCSGSEDTPNVVAPDLESVAIERGVVRDPDSREVAGLYARDGDRLCLVPAGERLRIGAFLLDEGRLACSASGTAERTRDGLRIDFGEGCRLEARVDDGAIAFPAKLPPECARRCAPRVSFAGLRVERLSDAVSEAGALRDPRGRALCGG